jgi:hypothetical protein
MTKPKLRQKLPQIMFKILILLINAVPVSSTNKINHLGDFGTGQFLAIIVLVPVRFRLIEVLGAGFAPFPCWLAGMVQAHTLENPDIK